VYNLLAYVMALYPGVYIRVGFKDLSKRKKRISSTLASFVPFVTAVFSPDAAIVLSTLEFFGLYALENGYFSFPEINIQLPELRKREERVQEDKIRPKPRIFPKDERKRRIIVRAIAERLYREHGKFHAAGIWRRLFEIYGDQVLKNRIYIEKWISFWMKNEKDIVFKEQLGRTKYYTFLSKDNLQNTYIFQEK